MSREKELIEDLLNTCLKEEIRVLHLSPVGGGCIHNAQKITTDKGAFFIKLNQKSSLKMFETERSGLQLLAEAGKIDVPAPLTTGVIGSQSYIVMNYIESNTRKHDFWAEFGRSLALLHHDHLHPQYGLSYDNFIGRLPQYNTFHDDWISFFISQRLEIQEKKAFEKGYLDRSDLDLFRRFYDLLPELLPEEPPSLLHGDLWSGNFMTGQQGQPVIIDPAVYYGNREIELSFTKMFGGFDELFYQSYNESYPLAPGFYERVDIYNIYPHLVHVNMFGSSYLSGVTPVLNRYG